MYAVNALFICFHCSDKANLIFRIDKQIQFLKFQSQIAQTLSSVTYHFFLHRRTKKDVLYVVQMLKFKICHVKDIINKAIWTFSASTRYICIFVAELYES